jgi:hypothetical protein
MPVSPTFDKGVTEGICPSRLPILIDTCPAREFDAGTFPQIEGDSVAGEKNLLEMLR